MSGCCGKNSSRQKMSEPIPVDQTSESSSIQGNRPIEELEPGTFALCSDGQNSYHGYMLQGKFHNVHGCVVPDFVPTHFFF